MDQPFDDNMLDNHQRLEKPDLDTTLETLKNLADGVATPSLYYGLSDLNPSEIARFEPVWNVLDASKRHSLLTELTEASELNFEFDYHELGFFALNDADQDVRQAAIDLLWEDESLELMNRLINLAQWDESTQVRATAVSALGRFVLLGEYGEISQSEFNRVQDIVINILTNDNEEFDVRRRALEAIANSSHEIVHEAILEAYNGTEPKMKVSSVYAMGRTYDTEWRDTVLRELSSEDPEIRYEAARAAGELGIRDSVPYLGRLAVEDEREIKEVSIWSLGEIASREALRILSALAEDAEAAEDDNLLEAIEDAIGSAALVGDELDLGVDD